VIEKFSDTDKIQKAFIRSDAGIAQNLSQFGEDSYSTYSLT
jgi:hypothetical protein